MTSLLLTVATVRLGLAGRVEDVEPSRSNFALLAHQLICLSLQRAGVTAEEAFEVLRRADPCAEIREDELTELVEHLLSTGILRRVDHLLLLGDEGEKRLGRAHLRELYSVFDSPPVYVAKHGSQEVGTLDLVYVLARKKLPFVIILAGRFWEVVGRDDKRRILRVRPCTHARAPAWHSKRPPFSISRLVAQEVRRVVLEAPSIALDRIRLNGPARAWLSGLGEIQDWQRIAHERVEVDPTTSRTAVLWTYGGDHLNWLLGRFLEATAGLQVVESDSRRIAVAAPEGGAGSCEEVILQALRSLGEMSESARTELSLAFAKDLVDFRITKYDDLIPPSLRAAEQARGLASLAHLRCLAG